MIVDGRAHATVIYARLRDACARFPTAPRLHIVTGEPTFATRSYLALKERKARAVGIDVTIHEFSREHTTDDIIATIAENISRCDGLLVQLPLPETFDRARILRAIPATHDVDALNGDTTLFVSPVVRACEEILLQASMSVAEKYVTIIGSGTLVGQPLYAWFVAQGAYVSMVTRDTGDIDAYTRGADIIVCGAGVPGILTPDMVQEGVVILDAGTSEDGGELRGDADPACATKAALFTPVPGGIGPLTVAFLLSNVAVSVARQLEDAIV